MNPEEWAQIDELFAQALNVPPDKRPALLDQACSGNDSLRRQVESLLASDSHAQSFLEQPPGEIAAELLSSETPRFEKGQLIGHYTVIGWLGGGGMGEVYLAQDSRLNRRVAIKVLRRPFLSDSNRVRRFVQEARAASSLNHPNIVTIHEVGQVEGAPFIVAEFIEGQTLRRRLPLDGSMPIQEAIDVALQVARALEAAHAAGIVHRDIKPDNIMIRPDGLVKVLDFGLAKLSETEVFASSADASTISTHHTNPGVLMGTVGYMSPEQAKGKRVDARTDIWSLGVVLLEMLAGKHPFDGETPTHLTGEVLDDDFPPLPTQVQGIPALDRIVAKSLCADIERRYQTAKEFADDLKDLRAQLQNPASVTATPTSRGSHNLWRRGIIAAVSTLALTAALLAYFDNPRQPIHSLAVMPFVNAGDVSDEYLSDGISESLTNALAQTPQLQVTPRSMVQRYKGADFDPDKVGRELGVRAILTSKFASHGELVDIQVDLLDVESMTALWRKTFNRHRVEVLDVQREIAATVASKLGLRVAEKSETKSNEAYQLYLQGRYYWEKNTAESNLKMGEYFRKAIAIDPNYALAYAGLADYYAALSAGGAMPGPEGWPKSEEAAIKALVLDDSLGEAHHSLAAVRMWYDRKWIDAEKELKRAIELKPDFAEAYSLYSRLLNALGRFDEAFAAAKKSAEVDPNGPHRRVVPAGGYYVRVARYDLAAEAFRKELEDNPGSPEPHMGLSQMYAQQKMFSEALSEARKAKAKANVKNQRQMARVGCLLAAAGDAPEAKKILEQAVSSTTRFNLSHSIGCIHAALGNHNEAITWLTKSVDSFDTSVIDLNVNRQFAPLRRDPRFTALLARLHLPQ